MNPQHSTTQLSLDFTPGLSERYDSVLECIQARIHMNAKRLKTIAAEMDMSSSDLSRKLANNPDDPRRFTVNDLENYVASTGDTTPILYLAQKFCSDSSFKQREALNALVNLMPDLQNLIKAAGAA